MQLELKYVNGVLVVKTTSTEMYDVTGKKYPVDTPVVVAVADVVSYVKDLGLAEFLREVDSLLDTKVSSLEEGVICVYIAETGKMYGSEELEELPISTIKEGLIIKIRKVTSPDLFFDMDLYSTFDSMRDRVNYLKNFPIKYTLDIIGLTPVYVPVIGEIHIKHCACEFSEVAVKNAKDWLRSLEETWC